MNQEIKNKHGLLSLFSKFVGKNEAEAVIPTQQQGVIASGISKEIGLKVTNTLGESDVFDAVLRRVIQIRDRLFFDILDYRTKTSDMMDVRNIVEIRDKTHKIIYRNPYRFLAQSLGIELENSPEEFSQFSHVLRKTRAEITALTYLSLLDGHRDVEQENLILEYVSRKCPGLKYDPEEVRNYIRGLVPDESCFYEAMLYLLSKESWEIKVFMETVIQLILSDGKVHPNEKMFLDELVTALRAEGISLNM